VGEAVVIGVVQRAHGIHGLVRARPTGPTLTELTAGEPVELTDRDGRTRRLVLSSAAPAGDAVLLGFEGIVNREDADALRGGTIAVGPARLPQAGAAGEFYVRELVGCAVTVGGRPIGAVRDVINRPANDVLEVQGDDGQVHLLPFTRDAVVAVDLAERRIELRTGLIDPTGTDAGDARDAG
jgi:16S rRNA processing protein RimM